MKNRTISVFVLIALLFSIIGNIFVYADGGLTVNANGYYIIDSADDFSKITDMSGTYWIVKNIELPDEITSRRLIRALEKAESPKKEKKLPNFCNLRTKKM